MIRVLVTGATGFIGNKIYNLFKDRGFTVYGCDLCERGEIFALDMINEVALTEVLNKIKPQIIIHCAGSADVGLSVKNPEKDFIGNAKLTHNLLFSLHKLNKTNLRLVFLSSAGVYGNPFRLPITEDMPLHPMSPYALHKTMCEDICRYFKFNYAMDIKVARIFSAYGAGLKKQIFWDMHNKAINTGRLDMFGTGNESRDYIHVQDVIQAIFLIATQESKDFIFNVANGEEVTIRRATETFARFTGITNISFNGVEREGDPLNWRADISKLKALGYKKSISFEDGIRDYIEWANNL